MKKTLLTLIIAAAGILASAQIRPEPKKDGGIFAGMDPATRIQLMKQFDKDGDGRLNEQERAAAREALKDKSADLEQLKKNHAKDVIKKFDVDGDGKLDQTELSAFLDEQRKLFDKQRKHIPPRRNFKPSKEMLAKFDKNGDGKLDGNERRAMFQHARAKREALIKKYDADGDGKLSDAERNNLIQDPEVQNMMKRMIGNAVPPPPPPPPPADN